MVSAWYVGCQFLPDPTGVYLQVALLGRSILDDTVSRPRRCQIRCYQDLGRHAVHFTHPASMDLSPRIGILTPLSLLGPNPAHP
ncbi:hypothetical protein N7510_010629 [Penicillium lagena]|uniref:uncharacterized protein n=1 Tax=Penicillium lagena TaxID=94218 RepID=UPI00253F8ABF|nr:uncharacterized protein N7510_010629 [Penicillium lagena]KAJ5601095.1 hypothetical protein N7510_010629 [Penicillium lagena]